MSYHPPRLLSTWDEVEQPEFVRFGSGDLLMPSPKKLHRQGLSLQKIRETASSILLYVAKPINPDESNVWGVQTNPETGQTRAAYHGFGEVNFALTSARTWKHAEPLLLLNKPIKVNFANFVPMNSFGSYFLGRGPDLVRFAAARKAARKYDERHWYLKLLGTNPEGNVEEYHTLVPNKAFEHNLCVAHEKRLRHYGFLEQQHQHEEDQTGDR